MMNKLFVVGDSTLSKFNDESYYYPRYGYGTQLDNYLDLEVVNLALSGRSSKSFLQEENYKILTESIGQGDYLLIGFGHNDEKSDDVARFTSANLPIDDEKSFLYSLNEHYLKLAYNVGATPILCTPIVRLALDGIYEGTLIHQTPNGDYRKAIMELGKITDTLVIDLTTLTKNLHESLSIDECICLHAITTGKLVEDNVEADFKSVDKSHLNVYGAKVVAGLIANKIAESDHPIKKHLFNLEVPKKEEVLVVNPTYKFKKYVCPDLDKYVPLEQFNAGLGGWYGTAFGDVGCNPQLIENGYVAKIKDGKFIVGQIGEKLYGRINSTADGIACCFKRVSINDNFVIKAKAKIIDLIPSKQTSFGLMLRDDIYINQDTKHKAVMNNYISAGFLTLNVSTNILFSRESKTELKMASNIFDGFYNLHDEAYLEIIRLGQAVKTKVIYKGKEYIKDYIDFDLVGIDKDYLYICLYSTCGTVVEYSDVEYIYTGKAIEA